MNAQYLDLDRLTNQEIVRVLVNRAIDQHQSWELSGLTCEEEPDPLQTLKDSLVAAVGQLEVLRNHAHKWDEDQRCVICGADGAA